MLPSYPTRYFPYQQKDKVPLFTTDTTTGSAYVNKTSTFVPSVPFCPPISVLARNCNKYTDNIYQSITKETYKPFVNQPPCCKYVNTPRCSIYDTNFKQPTDYKGDYFTTIHSKEYSNKSINDNISPAAGTSLNVRPRDQGRVMLTNNDDTSFDKGSEYDQCYVKHSLNGREDCLHIVEKMNKDNVKREIEPHNSSVFATTFGETFKNTLKMRQRSELSRLAQDEKGGVSSIPFGDRDKCKSFTSQHQDSYNTDSITNKQQNNCYDRKQALNNVYQSSVQFGDVKRYGGALSENIEYPNHDKQKRQPSVQYDRNRSSFPQGDLASHRVKERMSYLSSRVYAKPPPGSFPMYVDLSHLRTHSSVPIGEQRQNHSSDSNTCSYQLNTTSMDTYKPVTIKVIHALPPADNMGQAFRYKTEKPFISTTKESYDKKQLNTPTCNQSNLKESHWKLPFTGVSFETTQKSHYKPPPPSLVLQ